MSVKLIPGKLYKIENFLTNITEYGIYLRLDETNNSYAISNSYFVFLVGKIEIAMSRNFNKYTLVEL